VRSFQAFFLVKSSGIFPFYVARDFENFAFSVIGYVPGSIHELFADAAAAQPVIHEKFLYFCTGTIVVEKFLDVQTDEADHAIVQFRNDVMNAVISQIGGIDFFEIRLIESFVFKLTHHFVYSRAIP
jgi:hypothetical protein